MKTSEPHTVLQTVYVLIGIPNSGKSSYAKTVCKNAIRVNRDDIRAMGWTGTLDAEGCLTYPSSIEGMVTRIHNQIMVEALRKGHDVVVDNMNLRGSYRNDIRAICERHGNVQYQEIVFNTPLDLCLARNAARERKVPEKVIRRLHAQFQSFLSGYDYMEAGPVLGYSQTFWRKSPPKIEYALGCEPAIMCDLDGTAALHNGRDPYDAARCAEDLPNEPVRQTLWAFREAGYKIVYMSARADKYRPQTEEFFKLHNFPRGPLIMRNSGDDRNDAIVKEELFNAHVRGKYNVLLVLDDRDRVVQKWRDMGLTCFQVAPGDF